MNIQLRDNEIRKPRLLIAEDDQDLLRVLRKMFQRANYEIGTAEDGRKALEMWEGRKYDLILMDVQMPLMNGFEVAAAIREKERTWDGHIPIIAMTGMHKFFTADMDAYISKPIDFEACLKLVKELWSESDFNPDLPSASDVHFYG